MMNPAIQKPYTEIVSMIPSRGFPGTGQNGIISGYKNESSMICTHTPDTAPAIIDRKE